jgi:hypothetical protein
MEPLEKAAAKERMREGGKKGGKTAGRGRSNSSVEIFHKPIGPKTRDKIGAVAGVSGRAVAGLSRC